MDVAGLSDSDEDGEEVVKFRLYKPRINPFDSNLGDDERVLKRYRFSKDVILELVHLLMPALIRETERSQAIPPLLQVCAALRYLGTGADQIVIADSLGLSQQSISRAVTCFVDALGEKINDFIVFPTTAAAQTEIATAFYNMHGFPGMRALLFS